MLFIKDETTGTFNRGMDQLDHELLVFRQQYGSWQNLIDALSIEPVVNTQEYDHRIKAAFILWALEEYEHTQGRPASQGRLLRIWNR